MINRRNIILILQVNHPLLQEKSESFTQQQDLNDQREPEEKPDTISDQQSCNCQKNGCLKLYCSCFKDGKECSASCSCTKCKNVQVQPERASAIMKMIRKYKTNFVQKFEKNSAIGCNCKRSKCQQNYCECFIRNQGCNSTCKCKKCKNGKIDLKKSYSSQLEKPEENLINETIGLEQQIIQIFTKCTI